MQNSFVSKFLSVTGLKWFGKLLSVSTGIIAARVLGAEEYGEYGFYISIISVLCMFATAGMPDLLIKELSCSELKNEYPTIRGMLIWSRRYVLLTTLLSILIFLALIYFEVIGEISIIVLILITVFPFAQSLTVRGVAVISAFRKPVLSELPMMVLYLVMLILFASIAFLYTGLTGEHLLLINLLAYIAAFVLSLTIIVNLCNRNNLKSKSAIFRNKEWFNSLIPFSLMAICLGLNTQFVSVYVGITINTVSVGFFKVAMQGMIVVTFVLQAVNTVLAPHVARLYRDEKLDDVQTMLNKSARLSALFAAPVTFIYIAYGDFVIEIIFGKEFIPAGKLLAILCVGRLVDVLMGSVGLVLKMTGNEFALLKVLFSGLTLNLLLLLFLVPIYGVTGAAWSVTITTIFINVALAYKAYKATGLRPWLSFFR